MKLNKSTLKDMIREAMSGMAEEPANPSSAQEWHAWGETFGLAPEHDEDNQLIFYLSRDSQDPNKAAAEAVRAGASVDRDNDGNDVIYTGVYNREQVAETITKSTLKDMIREAIRAIHE